jgi:hypothetical protein
MAIEFCLDDEKILEMEAVIVAQQYVVLNPTELCIQKWLK